VNQDRIFIHPKNLFLLIIVITTANTVAKNAVTRKDFQYNRLGKRYMNRQ
jgi:hypothetical protein